VGELFGHGLFVLGRGQGCDFSSQFGPGRGQIALHCGQLGLQGVKLAVQLLGKLFDGKRWGLGQGGVQLSPYL